MQCLTVGLWAGFRAFDGLIRVSQRVADCADHQCRRMADWADHQRQGLEQAQADLSGRHLNLIRGLSLQVLFLSQAAILL